jgi:phospholipid/cholesterol/gamma-HCH transport system substrate-binding protein
VPSRQQVKWSQLRVGLTVLVATATLGLLIFLMTGTRGLFTGRLWLKAYLDNAAGLRTGAPVQLQGVDVGNITEIRVIPGRALTPVEVTFWISRKYADSVRKDSLIALIRSGVLGEVLVDIDSRAAKGPPAKNWDALTTRDTPSLDDVVRASQTTLQNLDSVLQRADRIVATIERGQGTLGKFIYDPELYSRLTASVADFQRILTTINRGNGTLGKLISDETLYQKANASVDKLSRIIDTIERGEGSMGKFLKDPALYNNANQTLARANKLMEDINSGRGTLGKLASDAEFARKIEVTVTRLAVIADRLENGEGAAGRLLNDPSLYHNANQMLVESRNLITAIRENPKKYLTIRMRIF